MAAIWKGVIRFGDVAVPVGVHAAVRDRKVHFRMLHATDGVPVKQQMVDAEEEEVVPRESIRRAYPLDDGSLVILQPDDLASLQPESSRDIEILRFVPPAAVGEEWYERPYHLAPDRTDAGEYAALVDALENTERIGIARWVMRKKNYVGILCARERRLALVTMRFANEVIAASDLPRPAGRAPTKKELGLAEQLVATLEEPLDITRFHDEYRERVRELVETKAEGGEVETPKLPARARASVGSLEDALRASLKKGGARRRAAKKKPKRGSGRSRGPARAAAGRGASRRAKGARSG